MDKERRTQADRRTASRGAILAAAARGIAQHGFSRLTLERVARDAGYTRGAVYHQFPGKEALALAVIEWISQTWMTEVGRPLAETGDAAQVLIEVARQHTVFCRNHNAATVMQMLAIEFKHDNQALGRATADLTEELTSRCREQILTGRRQGTIPPGPPATDTARAYISVLEAVAINSREPHDVVLTERAARGVLGL
ncbi:TetR/AcrR family transcriptional regulator [Nocardiopsis exhalans]|uniref:TetR/AcrR family transcriptional regulator n=1 Tax=Nocardiopsis exhalans TaxID=163604 RepID=A0ABY5D491_9ACTN|nr:TetR/AcrR family transcriptional regulator [Nocardiopsis exhalans]USY18576.1 TetR/AcrR family transcriptional regulator [Nocardiopsis exhalans]